MSILVIDEVSPQGDIPEILKYLSNVDMRFMRERIMHTRYVRSQELKCSSLGEISRSYEAGKTIIHALQNLQDVFQFYSAYIKIDDVSGTVDSKFAIRSMLSRENIQSSLLSDVNKPWSMMRLPCSDDIYQLVMQYTENDDKHAGSFYTVYMRKFNEITEKVFRTHTFIVNSSRILSYDMTFSSPSVLRNLLLEDMRELLNTSLT